jgi:hypothetical protein
MMRNKWKTNRKRSKQYEQNSFSGNQFCIQSFIICSSHLNHSN